ncbi:hypothetical protein [Ottowia beijingensis]|nr:hypothetical protein [Ottowia beijingensis]
MAQEARAADDLLGARLVGVGGRQLATINAARTRTGPKGCVRMK